jgi:hypothetical protein
VGVRRVFIGLENINPVNLAGAKKKQNNITEYRQMLLAWKEARVITYAGYILGFPNDTVESILHDIDVIKRELPVDLLELFYLTPLPGPEDHLKLFRAGAPLDDDLNKYDLNHVTTTHSKMSEADWNRIYQLAWQRYYTMGISTPCLNRSKCQQRAIPDYLVQGQHRSGKNSPVRKRFLPPQIPHRSPTRPVDRADLAVLSALLRRDRGQDDAVGDALSGPARTLPAHPPRHAAQEGRRAAQTCLYRSRHDAGERARASTGFIEPLWTVGEKAMSPAREQAARGRRLHGRPHNHSQAETHELFNN